MAVSFDAHTPEQLIQRLTAYQTAVRLHGFQPSKSAVKVEQNLRTMWPERPGETVRAIVYTKEPQHHFPAKARPDNYLMLVPQQIAPEHVWRSPEMQIPTERETFFFVSEVLTRLYLLQIWPSFFLIAPSESQSTSFPAGELEKIAEKAGHLTALYYPQIRTAHSLYNA